MDRLRQLLNAISAQLSLLTVSQRLAIGLCAALVAGSLLWLVQWSTTPELVPLVTHDFSYDELDAAEETLKANGVPYNVRGTRVYVRVGDRHNALRLLHSADALPEGSLFDMEAVVTDSNPFQSPEARAYAQTYAKGNELAKIIVTSPAVNKASVIINPVTKRRLGGVADVPTASVTVTLAKGREMAHDMVEGFAKLVAGGVAGLKPHNVYITDARTLRSYSLPHPDDAVSFNVLSMIKRREEHYRSKILSKLADIPGVQVAVSVELDMSKRVTQSIKHDLPQPKVETSSSTEQSSPFQPTEPGVQANLGQALTAATQGETGSTEETTVENFEPKLSQTETVEQMPFATTKITAAIGIPRSFIIGVFKAQHPEATDDPKDDDPTFVAVRDAQVERVKGSVERIVMAKNAEDVEVDVYPDMEWSADGGAWSRAPGEVALARQGGEGPDAIGLMRAYAPQVGLATLALVSLLLMMRMVRKSSEMAAPHRRLAAGRGKPYVEEPVLGVGVAPVGQAEVMKGMLAGKEVDATTLRYQDLAREVSKMVEEDPAGTAELIRRWVQESQ
ncbi:MAG: hypothetical protein JSU86_12090 [Phycisphaerales bacterium]|nr:MAG: hypothetical protein JSU86_12090 [Phycisphaerales bacterium]